MTQFKEKSAGKDSVRVGLFTYPVLQSADILLYDAERVPVGDDQRQHLELARQLALTVQPPVRPHLRRPRGGLPDHRGPGHGPPAPRGQDVQVDQLPPRTILLLDEPDDIRRKVKKAVTDTDGEVRYDPGAKPGLSNLLELLARGHRPVAGRGGGCATRYGDLKNDVAEALAVAPPGPRAPGGPGRRPGRGAAAGQRGRQGPGVASATYRRAAAAIGL